MAALRSPVSAGFLTRRTRTACSLEEEMRGGGGCSDSEGVCKGVKCDCVCQCQRGSIWIEKVRVCVCV